MEESLMKRALLFIACLLILTPAVSTQEGDRAEGERDSDQKIASMEHKIQSLLDEADRLKEQGRLEEAESLRNRAESLAARLEDHMRTLEEKELERTKHWIQELIRSAEEARAAGKEKEAQIALTEAAKLENWLVRERDERMLARTVEEHERKIRELHENAEILEGRGEFEEAARQFEEARAVERKLQQMLRDLGDRKLNRISEDLVTLRNRAKEAEQRGNQAEAANLWSRAEEIERELIREKSRMEFQAQLDKEHRAIEAIFEEAESAEREGDQERAEDFRRKGEEFQRQMEVMIYSAEREDRMRELDHLRLAMEKAAAEGRLEEARALGQKVKELAESTHEMEEKKQQTREEMLAREVAALREEVKFLRWELDRQKRRGTINPEYTKAYNELQRLRRELEDKSGKWTPKHTKMQKLKESLKAQEWIVRELERAKYLEDVDSASERVLFHVYRKPEVREFMDQKKAYLLTENRYDEEKGLWIFDLRRDHDGPVLARVMADEEGMVKGFETVPQRR
jgi:hypothetical protein